jgi:hypothetical protein
VFKIANVERSEPVTLFGADVRVVTFMDRHLRLTVCFNYRTRKGQLAFICGRT